MNKKIVARFFSFNLKVLLLVFFISQLVLFTSCNKRITNVEDVIPPDSSLVPSFGTSGTFELASWNIENFPYGDYRNPRTNWEQTVINVEKIIEDLDIDIFAVQEITDTVAFRMLLNRLEDYDGLYSDDQYSNGNYQKTAIIYKKSIITVSRKKMLYTNDSYSFPRPPLQVYVVARNNNRQFDFTLIVLHLKASSGSENEARRKSAVRKLKTYLDEQRSSNPDPDFIVAGDWNDRLEDPPDVNVFLPLLQDSLNYYFLTLPFAGSSTEYSYIKSYRSLIDHIMVTNSIRQTYPDIETKILKIDEYFTKFLEEVSDHRPVAFKIPAF